MENSTTPKQKRSRSSSYPALNLEKAIDNARKIKDALGKGPFSRDSAARALGYSGISGKSSTATAALVHYDLLTRNGNTYSISDLTDQILTYRDENERTSAIARAAQAPKLYRKLIEEYSGKSIPSMLPHILSRDYGINERVASQVTKTFSDSMQFAGLLVNGVLTDSLASAGVNDHGAPDSISRAEPAPLAGSNSSNTVDPVSLGTQVVEIADGITLSYPADRAFELFTNPKFPTALQSLKDALKNKSEASVSSGEDEGESI